ncbi:MAG: hydrogenase maturation nickel metallochaperone HypA [Mycobacteriales bacterium]
MHELSVTQSVVDAVIDRMGEAEVTSVLLEIGKLSGIEPDSVKFCFEIVASGTTLENASLEIVELPGQGRCRACHEVLTIDDRILLCTCGSADVEVLGGAELRIRSVEVA